MAKRDLYVSRKIYFYRLENPEEILRVLPDDLARIANLPFSETGRYLLDGDAERLCAWPDSLEFPLKLRFGRTRLQNLPTKELRGKLETLGLEADAGLAELMHVVIFADGYVAAEFNHDAPRINRLGVYLFSKKNKLATKPVFRPLFQKDVVSLVKGMVTVDFLELTGKPDAQYLLAEADKTLAKAYESIGALGANKTIQLGLRAQPRHDSKLRELGNKLARLAFENPWEIRHSVSKLKISGVASEGRIDCVDLLEDHLITSRKFERVSDKDKAVSSASAYSQIVSAYEEKRTLFAEAAVGRMFI